MSGSIAALSAFNASGTQGSAVVENIDKDKGDVLSVIYNKNDTTRQLITGTSLVEVTEMGVPHPEGLNNKLSTYVVNSDVDVVGELYLTLDVEKEFKIPKTVIDAAAAAASSGAIEDAIPLYLGREDFLSFGSDYTYTPFIKRIEICVGTQVFQKITPADINTSSRLNGVDAAAVLSYVTSKISGRTRGQNVADEDTFKDRANDVHIASWKIGFQIPTIMDTILPKFSNFTDQKNNGYVMAAAPHQDMNIKIYFGDGVVNKNDSMSRIPKQRRVDRLVPTTLTIRAASLTMKHTTLSNTERVLIRENPFSKRVSFLQTVESDPYIYATGNPSYNITRPGTANIVAPIPPILPPLTIDINCDTFNTFASGLYIQRSNIPFIEISTGQLNYSSANPVATVELLLNGNSFTREIDIETLIYCQTQNIETSELSTFFTTFANGGLYGFYLPLANNIYGSGVPMNRFDNITVRIRYQFPDELFADTFIFEDNWQKTWKPESISFRYAVTCVGETSLLYDGGASSITRF